MFEVKRLVFKYPKNKEDTIKGISFAIQPGEIFGLLGPSGVGKSTTQRVLVKLLKNYQGGVTYRGKDLQSYDKDFYQEIGVGFEMPVHFSKLTARENLNFFKRLYKVNEDTDELMEKVGLLNDQDKKVAEFSKGMKVRLNFVRALLNKPKMLFLDEPTNGLDPKNARVLKDMIKEYRQAGGTVFLTTHLMGDAEELCDRVAFMSDGQIREIDSPKNLKIKHGKRLLTVEYDDGQAKRREFDLDQISENEEFFQIMRTHRIITVHSGETTLDDIFIKIVEGKGNE